MLLFQGAHITINARSEDDVDEDDILKKVAKSSGCNYSFHKEKAQPGMNVPTGPVVRCNDRYYLYITSQ
jgi:hypothetical protein